MKIHTFGPYQTEEILGRGGMGTVYKGIHKETRQVVAVKVLSFIHADDDNFRERFGLEIETLKKLRHPHIVELYGYGVQDGHPFYAMEFIDGSSLQQELDSGRRFDWRETTRFTIAICQALKHAHDRGVIHRDLKPANLLFGEDKQVKLSDFGIAKLFGAHRITADRSVIGTADYMAPEQADGVQANAKSDLYSLGSVMYALVSGKPPFAAPTLAKVLSDLRHSEAIPLSQHVPQIPPEFEGIVMHLLQKEPEKRMATALALANHLRAIEHVINNRIATDVQAVPPESSSTKIATEAMAQQENASSEDTRALHPTVEAPQYSGGEGLPTGPTIAAHSQQARGPTQVVATTSELAEQQADHFTKVDPNRPLVEEPFGDKETLLVTCIKVGLSAVLLLLFIVGALSFLKPASESQVLQRIEAAAQKETPDALLGVSQQINTFLDRFPESPHYDQVKKYQEEVVLQRLHRSFEHKTRNTRIAGKLNPVARAYLEALQKSRTDQEAATVQMQAVIDLFSGMPDQESQQYVKLARADLADLEKQVAQRRKESLEMLKSRLQHANTLSKTDAEAAQAIYGGIIILYGDKSWATDIVEQARQRLQPLIGKDRIEHR